MTTVFKELDIVRLKSPRLDLGINKDCIGSIVDVHDNGKAFTVEFVDDNKETIVESLWTEFTPDELSLVQSYENNHEKVA